MTERPKQNSTPSRQSGVPGCWPVLLLPFTIGGTVIVVHSVSILWFIWNHPNITSYTLGGYYRLGRFYYPLPPSLPADPQTMEMIRNSLVLQTLLIALFALILLVLWLVIIAWIVSSLVILLSGAKTGEVERSENPPTDADRMTVLPDIVFTWKEQTYAVSMQAYYRERILLPDGCTLLKPEGGWREERATVPNGLVALPCRRRSNETLEMMAQRYGACLARVVPTSPELLGHSGELGD